MILKGEAAEKCRTYHQTITNLEEARKLFEECKQNYKQCVALEPQLKELQRRKQRYELKKKELEKEEAAERKL